MTVEPTPEMIEAAKRAGTFGASNRTRSTDEIWRDVAAAVLAHLPPDPEVEELKTRVVELDVSVDILKAQLQASHAERDTLAAQLDALATAINNASEVLETDEPWANSEADSILQLALQSLSSHTNAKGRLRNEEGE